MTDWSGYALLVVVGSVAGVINVVAGGGSFLTLPVLIFMGLPAVVANGTNRVAILLQNVGAVWGFQRHGVLDWRAVLWAAVPATAGSVLGTWAALVISDEAFKRVLAGLMVAVTLWTLWNPVERHRSDRPHETRVSTDSWMGLLPLGAGFFVVGIYGGFVQAGVGFFILAVTTWVGLDLVRGNAVKVLSVLVFTAVSLGIFAWQGKVHWPMGLALAAGNVAGGLIGVRLTVLKGHAWVKGAVTIAIIVFAILLLID